MNTEENLITEKDAAARLGKHQKTLYRWRQAGVAPRHVKLPTGSVLYRPHDLQAFLEANTPASLFWP